MSVTTDITGCTLAISRDSYHVKAERPGLCGPKCCLLALENIFAYADAGVAQRLHLSVFLRDSNQPVLTIDSQMPARGPAVAAPPWGQASRSKTGHSSSQCSQ